ARPGHAQTQRIVDELLAAQISTPPPSPQSAPAPRAVATPAAPPTVGIITALPHETAAILTVLGEPPPAHVPGAGAGRTYWRAHVPSAHGGAHEVIVAQADMGNNVAAIRAGLLLAHFPSVESIIMCGIAGGIPNPKKADEQVRLGDVIVSNH